MNITVLRLKVTKKLVKRRKRKKKTLILKKHHQHNCKCDFVIIQLILIPLILNL